MNSKNIQSYLPSKQFQKFLGAFLVIGLFVFVVFFIFSNQKEKFSRYKNELKVNEQTISEIIAEDTDGDGIPDWEESLWGTDKNKKFTFGEISDSTYIQNKKEALNVEQEINNKALTETDIFAREFFTAYTALKENEGIGSEDIYNISNALGQKIVNPKLEDIYSEKNIKTIDDETEKAIIEYYLEIKKLFNIYQESGIGDELEIISNGILSYTNDGKKGKINDLLLIGQSYQEFAKKALEIEVPNILSTYHLQIINSAHNTGVSVLKMAEVIEDPIVGLSALSSYEKYSKELIDTVTTVEEYLE